MVIEIKNNYLKAGDINDPLGQPDRQIALVQFWKVGTDKPENIYKNSDQYRLWLWIGLVDQKEIISFIHFFEKKINSFELPVQIACHKISSL